MSELPNLTLYGMLIFILLSQSTRHFLEIATFQEPIKILTFCSIQRLGWLCCHAANSCMAPANVGTALGLVSKGLGNTSVTSHTQSPRFCANQPPKTCGGGPGPQFHIAYKNELSAQLNLQSCNNLHTSTCHTLTTFTKTTCLRN